MYDLVFIYILQSTCPQYDPCASNGKAPGILTLFPTTLAQVRTLFYASGDETQEDLEPAGPGFHHCPIPYHQSQVGTFEWNLVQFKVMHWGFFFSVFSWNAKLISSCPIRKLGWECSPFGRVLAQQTQSLGFDLQYHRNWVWWCTPVGSTLLRVRGRKIRSWSSSSATSGLAWVTGDPISNKKRKSVWLDKH